MWHDNPIVKMCKVRFPIIQAPMSGVTTPRLVASVSNAGGLGSLGAAHMSPQEIRESIQEIRDLTEQPFAVNLFACASAPKNTRLINSAKEFLERYRNDLGIPQSTADFSSFPDFFEQFEVLLAEKVPVFSFTMGIPPLPMLQQLKKQKTVVMGTATSLDEALLLESSGVDAIIAQGVESGGHRGTFLDPANDLMLGLSTLIPLFAHSLQVPVVAAGGIMNGEGIASVLALGASAAQLGTAFIACPESGAPRPYKDSLLHPHSAETIITSAFSGRPARAVRNKFIKEMTELEAPIAPFPYQNALTKEIRTAAAKMNRPDLMSLYAGQNYPLITNLPASEIIPLLVEQTVMAVQRLSNELLRRKA